DSHGPVRRLAEVFRRRSVRPFGRGPGRRPGPNASRRVFMLPMPSWLFVMNERIAVNPRWISPTLLACCAVVAVSGQTAAPVVRFRDVTKAAGITFTHNQRPT